MSAGESVLALVSGLPSDQRGKRLMMALQAYIDDSGTAPDQSIFVLAGFVASSDQWAALSDDWKAALALDPSLEYFKASEAYSLNGQFKKRRGWTRDKRDARVAILADIIAKHVQMRTAAWLRRSDFNATIKELKVPKPHALVDNPYFLCFYRVILYTAALQEIIGRKEPCDFFFDEQSSLGLETLARWPIFKMSAGQASKTDFTPYIGSPPIFRDDKEFMLT